MVYVIVFWSIYLWVCHRYFLIFINRTVSTKMIYRYWPFHILDPFLVWTHVEASYTATSVEIYRTAYKSTKLERHWSKAHLFIIKKQMWLEIKEGMQSDIIGMTSASCFESSWRSTGQPTVNCESQNVKHPDIRQYIVVLYTGHSCYLNIIQAEVLVYGFIVMTGIELLLFFYRYLFA